MEGEVGGMEKVYGKEVNHRGQRGAEE